MSLQVRYDLDLAAGREGAAVRRDVRPVPMRVTA